MALNLLDFWAPWCPPCKIMDPVMEEVEKEFKGKITVVKHNVDEEPEVAQNYSVLSIPTYVIEKDGQEVARTTGARPAEEFKKWVAEHA